MIIIYDEREVVYQVLGYLNFKIRDERNIKQKILRIRNKLSIN